MVKPFTPQAAKDAQQNAVPEIVLSIVNHFLAQRAASNLIFINQKEVVEQLEEAGYTRSAIFAEHLLDFEAAYRANGWKVVYDKPAYNETYDPRWEFSPIS